MAQYDQSRTRLLEAASCCSAREYAEAVARFHWDGSVTLPTVRDRHEIAVGSERGCLSRSDDAGISAWKLAGSPHTTEAAAAETAALRGSARFVPLALVGGPLPRSEWGVLDTIERAGGRVVLNATEAGERTLMSLDLNKAGDPRDMLARRYVQGCVDVFQRPNTRLYAWLKERLTARQARGIVLWHYVGCDLWRAEAPSLREAFGLPVLLLQAEEAQADSLRNAGRIQAFVETLR
jgi:hypothetical protein